MKTGSLGNFFNTPLTQYIIFYASYQRKPSLKPHYLVKECCDHIFNCHSSPDWFPLTSRLPFLPVSHNPTHIYSYKIIYLTLNPFHFKVVFLACQISLAYSFTHSPHCNCAQASAFLYCLYFFPSSLLSCTYWSYLKKPVIKSSSDCILMLLTIYCQK